MSRYGERVLSDSKKGEKKATKSFFLRRLSIDWCSWVSFEPKDFFEQNYTVDDLTVKIFHKAKTRNPRGDPQHFTLPSSSRERPHERNEGQLGPKIRRYLWTFGSHAGTQPADYNTYDSLMARRLPIFQQYLMESCFWKESAFERNKQSSSQLFINFGTVTSFLMKQSGFIYQPKPDE